MSIKKRCRQCGKKKSLSRFHADQKGRHGVRGSCRKCENARKRESYRANISNEERKAHKILNAARQRARKRGADFSIAIEDVMPQIHLGACSVTGIPFNYESPGHGIRNPYGPSIDRIDSSKGYTPDNIRIVIFALNLMLADFGDEVFEHVAKTYLRERKKNGDNKLDNFAAKKSKAPSLSRHGKAPGVGSKHGRGSKRTRDARTLQGK